MLNYERQVIIMTYENQVKFIEELKKMEFKKKITDKKLIAYLAEKGITPVKQNDYYAIYANTKRLKLALENYDILSCFKNWQPLYK